MTHKQRPKASAPAFSPTGKTPPPPTSIYDRWVQANGIMFGFDAQHSGFNPYERLLNTGNVSHLTLAWTSDPLGRNFFSSPVVSNGVVYVTTSTNQVFAIDVTTGHVRWSSSASPLASVSASGNFSTPAVVNGIVYVCLQDRHLYAFDALSGQLRWTTSGDEGELFSSPIVADGVVYITGGGGVDAFDAITGRHLWASATTEYLAQPVAVAHGMVYVGISDSSPSTGRVAALDARNGKVRWISDLIRGEGIDTNSSPTVENGLVYIGAGNGGIAAFDANTGHVLWVTPATKASTGSSPEVANGVVYITEDKVYAFNARTGAALWSSPPVGAYNDDSPTIANGVLYVGSAATNGTYIGSVYALDAATGKVLWASPPTSGQIFTTPAVANGVVYIASGDPDGKLYAFHLPS